MKYPNGTKIVSALGKMSKPFKDQSREDRARLYYAAEDFSKFISKPILQVIEDAPVISNLFSSENKI